MDFYEQLVHFYLTAIEKCAVIPQVEILLSTAGESWAAYPNFLAIDFNNQVIQIVELTKGADAVARLGPKLKQEHRRNVEAYIKKFVQGRLNFPIVWRFVVRQKDIRSLESQPDFVAFTESGRFRSITFIPAHGSRAWISDTQDRSGPATAPRR